MRGKCGHALYYCSNTSIAKAETLCSEQQNHEKTAMKNIFSVLFFINLLFIEASFNVQNWCMFFFKHNYFNLQIFES